MGSENDACCFMLPVPKVEIKKAIFQNAQKMGIFVQGQKEGRYNQPKTAIWISKK